MTPINRFLQVFNGVGVGVLTALCVAQWQTDTRLAERANELDRTGRQQSATLGDQQKTLQDDSTEIDRLHQQLSAVETAEKDSAAKQASAETERDAALADRDRTREALSQWQTALAARDAALQKAGVQLRSVAEQRDDAIRRYNDLATAARPASHAAGG